MFGLSYYENKKANRLEKFQKFQNDTFTSFLQIAANFFNQKAEADADIKEIEQIIKESMNDEEKTTPEVVSDAASDVASDVASDAEVPSEPSPAE